MSSVPITETPFYTSVEQRVKEASQNKWKLHMPGNMKYINDSVNQVVNQIVNQKTNNASCNWGVTPITTITKCDFPIYVSEDTKIYAQPIVNKGINLPDGKYWINGTEVLINGPEITMIPKQKPKTEVDYFKIMKELIEGN